MEDSNYRYDMDPVFHERPHLLASRSYRGLSVKDREKHWDGIKVTVTSKQGMKISAIDETEHEALKKCIDQIDLYLDQ